MANSTIIDASSLVQDAAKYIINKCPSDILALNNAEELAKWLLSEGQIDTSIIQYRTITYTDSGLLGENVLSACLDCANIFPLDFLFFIKYLLEEFGHNFNIKTLCTISDNPYFKEFLNQRYDAKYDDPLEGYDSEYKINFNKGLNLASDEVILPCMPLVMIKGKFSDIANISDKIIIEHPNAELYVALLNRDKNKFKKLINTNTLYVDYKADWELNYNWIISDIIDYLPGPISIKKLGAYRYEFTGLRKDLLAFVHNCANLCDDVVLSPFIDYNYRGGWEEKDLSEYGWMWNRLV